MIPPDLNSAPEMVPSNVTLPVSGKMGTDAGGAGNEHVMGAVAVTSPRFSAIDKKYLPL